jgi:outer membrane scaffolding protein for murein synthesis (MipA/OmpV family)
MRPAMPTMLASFMLAGSASAGGMMDALMPDNAPSVVGLAAGVVPDYQGSDDYTVGVAPMARYQFKDSNRHVLLMANELSLNLVNSPSWRAGPVLNYSFGARTSRTMWWTGWTPWMASSSTAPSFNTFRWTRIIRVIAGAWA